MWRVEPPPAGQGDLSRWCPLATRPMARPRVWDTGLNTPSSFLPGGTCYSPTILSYCARISVSCFITLAVVTSVCPGRPTTPSKDTEGNQMGRAELCLVEPQGTCFNK